MVEPLQNLTQKNQTSEVEVIPIPYSELSPAQQYWVDFCALQGLITGDDGEFSKMTIRECAEQLGITRQTLYDWKRSIPNFDALVADRCSELWSGARTVKVVNALFLNATSKMSVQAQALWLANQKRIPFRMPTQPIKHDVAGGLADLLNIARERQLESENVIEGEIVEPNNQTSNA